ncbi:putative transcriptional regulatory protein At2g25830 [Bidens hawaiensis]|uniref:putative transcriptional regulatory protein At2g25830 n=1 Tax=Bidens hawaiensis TaxID=980011 RepID=UPI004049024F
MSSSSTRSFGALLYRFSTTINLNLKSPNSFPIQGALRLHTNLSSSALYSSCAKWVNPIEFQSVGSVRKIWTRGPLCMGRRSCKIAGRKGVQDAKKAKLYAKVGKEVVSAVKKGGPSPISNTALAAILEKAKELDVPKDILERNIKRASDKNQEAYIEKVYEVYGYGGVGIIVEVSTDKINRSVALVREVVKDCGGKMADPGSIMFKFKRARVVNVKVTDADKDQLLNIALDAGADDVVEPSIDDDEPEEDKAKRYYKIVSSSENYGEILSKLREEGVTFEQDNGSELLPLTMIEVDDEAMELNKELMSNLLDLDDVDAVYTDQR